MARGRWRGEDAARGGRLRTSDAVFALFDRAARCANCEPPVRSFGRAVAGIARHPRAKDALARRRRSGPTRKPFGRNNRRHIATPGVRACLSA